jgi:proline iminopeptidase
VGTPSRRDHDKRLDPVEPSIVDRYRVQSHYLAHDCWLAEPPLPERCADLPSVPVCMLHGTDDRVCPIGAADELRRHIPQARWHALPGVGHDPAHPAMMAAMRSALAAFARDGHFDAMTSDAFHDRAR